MNKTIPNSRWQLGLEIRPLSSGGVSACHSEVIEEQHSSRLSLLSKKLS